MNYKDLDQSSRQEWDLYEGTEVTGQPSRSPGKQTLTARLPPRMRSARPSAQVPLQQNTDHSDVLQRKQDAMLTEQWMNAALRPDLHGPPVQMYGDEQTVGNVHDLANEGISGTAIALPHLEQIQLAFGRHDVSGTKAHVGGPAAVASQAMGARAYATGNHVAFRTTPDLHTAAHEAAHVVQQRAGVQLEDGVGRSGDPYERHADAVADAVVAGQSAQGLLDKATGCTSASTSGVQRSAVVQQDGGKPADSGGSDFNAANAGQDVIGGTGAVLEVEAFLREVYRNADAAIVREADYMLSKGVPEAEVARWTTEARNTAKAKIRRWDLDVVRKLAEQRNMRVYGNKLGPSYEQLRTGDPARGKLPTTNAQIIESAGRTNPTVNKWAGRMKIAGRIMIAIDFGIAGYKVVMAPPRDRPKVLIKEAGGIAGALAGGWAGAKGGGAAGAWFGPWGAGIGAVLGGVGGAIAGGWAGRKAGEVLVDQLYPPSDTEFIGAFQ